MTGNSNDDTRISKVQNHLDGISETVLRKFGDLCQIRHLHVQATGGDYFHVYAIFRTDKALARFMRNTNGIRKILEECVRAELVALGVPTYVSANFEFEAESDEMMAMQLRENRATNIPSEEDFARATRLDAERNRHLDLVSANVMCRFAGRCPLHNLYLFRESDVRFRMYVFFKTDSDIEECKAHGMTTAIENAVYEELERYGRGTRGNILVTFEYDSDENVDRNFGGDYLYRLR